jgi:hypothetical protein
LLATPDWLLLTCTPAPGAQQRRWDLGSSGGFLQAGLSRQILQRWDVGHALG